MGSFSLLKYVSILFSSLLKTLIVAMIFLPVLLDILEYAVDYRMVLLQSRTQQVIIIIEPEVIHMLDRLKKMRHRAGRQAKRRHQSASARQGIAGGRH